MGGSIKTRRRQQTTPEEELIVMGNRWSSRPACPSQVVSKPPGFKSTLITRIISGLVVSIWRTNAAYSPTIIRILLTSFCRRFFCPFCMTVRGHVNCANLALTRIKHFKPQTWVIYREVLRIEVRSYDSWQVLVISIIK